MIFEHPSFNNIEEAEEKTAHYPFKTLQILPDGRVYSSIAMFESDEELKGGLEHPQQMRKLLYINHSQSLDHQMVNYLFREGESEKENSPQFIKNWFKALAHNMTIDENGELIENDSVPQFEALDENNLALEELISEVNAFLWEKESFLNDVIEKDPSVIDALTDLILQVFNMGIEFGWYDCQDKTYLKDLYNFHNSDEGVKTPD